jgi:predicted RNA-binding Zn-ribbon protein involved in translation (DUF1610 family)
MPHWAGPDIAHPNCPRCGAQMALIGPPGPPSGAGLRAERRMFECPACGHQVIAEVADRDRLLERLNMAERHVAVGEESLSRQTKVIEELERDGHDATRARALLSTFLALQDEHVAHRDRILKELGE